MDSKQVLEFVDQLSLGKKIDREQVFNIIEQALVSAVRKHSPEGTDVAVHVDRQTGDISVYRDNVPLSTEEITERIGAQAARQTIMQKIHDAEKERIYEECCNQLNELVVGSVQRVVRGNSSRVDIALSNGVVAELPKNEQIPGENYRQDARISALLVSVDKNGRGGNNQNVRVILSRSRPAFLQKLFEQEVPEISEGVIEIKEVSRDAGHRAKVAVTSSDPRLDIVGACIGTRGARIRAIRGELNSGEQIDVIPWAPKPDDFIKNALQPAVVDEVILCTVLGRAIVLVQKDQRSLAIGRKGQNVRLASRLCGWDVDIMTQEELQDILDHAVEEFSSIPGVSSELADHLVAEGFLSYDDLSIIEPAYLMEIGEISAEDAEAIIEESECRAESRTAMSASSDAIDAAMAAAEEAERAVNTTDGAEASRAAKAARSAANAASEAAREAERSAQVIDEPEVHEAVQKAKRAAADASRKAEEAAAAAAKFRNNDDFRSGNGRGNGSQRSRYPNSGNGGY